MLCCNKEIVSNLFLIAVSSWNIIVCFSFLAFGATVTNGTTIKFNVGIIVFNKY